MMHKTFIAASLLLAIVGGCGEKEESKSAAAPAPSQTAVPPATSPATASASPAPASEAPPQTASAAPISPAVAAEGQTCAPARARAATLLAELQPKILAAAKSAAEAYVKAPSTSTTTAAEAWNQVAGVSYLYGDYVNALWAELTALGLDWQPEYVTNAGVYLVKLNNPADARMFLRCALEMGYRSPYLFEALALAAHASGDKAEAVKQIQAAAAEAPDDALIQAEAVWITTGKPPVPPIRGAGPGPAGSTDALDRALRDLERHFEAVVRHFKWRDALTWQLEELRTGRKLSDDYADYEPEQGRAAAERRARYRGYLESVRKIVERARLSRHAGEHAGLWNLALHQATILYFAATDQLLSLGRRTYPPLDVRPEGASVLFWAEVFRISPFVHVEQIREYRAEMSKHMLYPTADEGWLTTVLGLQSRPGYSLDAAVRAREAPVARAAGQKFKEGTEECSRKFHAGSQIEQEKTCRRQVNQEWCQAMTGIFERYARDAREPFDLADRRYDIVAGKLLAWGAEQVLDARDYAVRTLSDLKPQPGTNFDYVKETNTKYRELVEQVVGDPAKLRGDPPAVLVHNTTRWFLGNWRDTNRDFATFATGLQKRCAVVRQEALPPLATRAVPKVLLGEPVVELDAKKPTPMPSCTVSYGPGLVTISGTGKAALSGKLELLKGPLGEREHEKGALGDLKVTAVDGESLGGAFNVSAGGWYGPFKGKADIDLAADYKLAPKSWDSYAQLNVAPPLGPKKTGGTACFPGELSVTFYPRAVMKDAAAYLRALRLSP